MDSPAVSRNSVWNVLNNYQPTLATSPNTQIASLSSPLDQNRLILNLLIALLQQLIAKLSQNLGGESTTQPAAQQNQNTNAQPAVQQNTTTQPAVQQNTTTQPAAQPSTTTQPAAQPSQTTNTQPAAQPSTTTQPAAQQNTTTQPATQPSTTTQPVTQPSTTTQPVTQPSQTTNTQPAAQPSTNTQPATQQNQNTTTQPATQPSTTTQPAAQVPPVNTNLPAPNQKVIDVYLLGGQSNAAGLGASRLEKALENRLGADTPNHETTVFSYAVGGTNLYSQWKADGTANKTKDGTLYQTFQNQLDAYMKTLKNKNPDAQINIAGMFWHQGESDAIEGKSKEYADNLSRFIQDVRATTANPTLPFMIGRLTDTNATARYKLGDVQRAQDEVANKTPNTVSVKMEEAEASDIHFTAKGYGTMAKLFADAYAEKFIKNS